jgi:hypothetical protein
MPASRAQQATTAERRKKAIAMRLAGADWDAIADKLGYASRGAAHTDVTRAMEKAAAEATRDADVLRQIELERINRLQVAYWPKAIAGDTDAAKVVQWCIDRRAKLTGLDAPIKHQVVSIGAIEAEIAKLEADLAAKAPAAWPTD